METVDILTIFAILVGPTFAVCITLWWQNRKEKRDAKIKLFFTLFSMRKVNPPNIEQATALNSIDVVFHDNKAVVNLWHTYLSLIYHQPVDWSSAYKTYLDLLHDIAVVLGYKNIRQTTIDSYYSPQYLGEKTKTEEVIRSELLRVLKNTNSLSDIKTENKQ